MVETVCYIFIFLFETLACFLFYENVYTRKTTKIKCFIAYSISYIVQFSLSFLIPPILKLILFAVCFWLISYLCYDSDVKSRTYYSLVLTGFMFLTEIVIVTISSLIFGIDFNAFEDDLLVLITQSSLSKLIFFVVMFFISKFIKIKKSGQSPNKYTMVLGTLPLTTIIILYFLIYFGINYTVVPPYSSALTTCTILLLFSNVFVFYIYEKVQKTNEEINKLHLENQRNEVSKELYDSMSVALDNSRILVHDVKNHFGSIFTIAKENNYTQVTEYINSIYDTFGLDKDVKYSGNKMVDVIINRYVENCKTKGIFLDIESCCSNLDFMSDVDIVSLLTNMFDNSIESALRSQKREIIFSINVRNNNYVTVQTTNSCDEKPKSRNGKLVSNKKDPTSHGVGTQSIKRVVERYNGSFLWNYDEVSHEFKASALLRIK